MALFRILVLSLLVFFHAQASTPLVEGKTYRYPLGWRSLFGSGELVYSQGVYHLKAKLLFVGAGTYFRTNAAEVQKHGLLRVAPPAKYFEKPFYSFADAPAFLKDRLNIILRTVESVFDTPFFKLKIEPVFIDERQILPPESINELSYNAYQSDLFSAINQLYSDPSGKNARAAVIYLNAIPNSQVATPTIWDLYSNPLLFAHEFAHLMGTHSEGYELEAYPANGVMNGEADFDAFLKLAPKGMKISFLRSDFNEAMQRMLRRAEPPLDKESIDTFFTETTVDLYNESAYEDYWQWSPEKRRQEAETKVKGWLRKTH